MAPSSEPAGDPASWPIYSDATFGFTLHYPNTYTIVPEPAQADASVPDRVKQVRFLDKTLAASDTAALQPADFAIEVFANPSNRTLVDWLDMQALAGDRSALTIGAQPAYRVSLKTQQYPNQFYYVAVSRYIYRITALGAYGEQILATITFAAQPR